MPFINPESLKMDWETGEILGIESEHDFKLQFEQAPEWTDHEAPQRAPLIIKKDEINMSILDSIITTIPGAPRVTIYGKPGIGKSTLASQFPTPLFLLTEDNEVPGIQALPLFTDYKALWDSVTQLLAVEDLPFKTIVIDSISKLDALVVDRVLEQSPPIGKDKRTPATLAEAFGGYGAGFEKAALLHKALKAKFDKFKERGISVVYISHLEIKKYKSPEAEDYDILSIVMNSDKSRMVYIDDVDAVLYCKNKSHVVEVDEKSKRSIVKSSGQRIICGASNEVHVSKNRYALPNEIPMTFTDLAKFIPFYNKEG